MHVTATGMQYAYSLFYDNSIMSSGMMAKFDSPSWSFTTMIDVGVPGLASIASCSKSGQASPVSMGNHSGAPRRSAGVLAAQCATMTARGDVRTHVEVSRDVQCLSAF